MKRVNLNVCAVTRESLLDGSTMIIVIVQMGRMSPVQTHVQMVFSIAVIRQGKFPLYIWRQQS